MKRLLPAIAAFSLLSQGGVEASFKETFFDVGYTFRADRLNWSIGDPEEGPNILSELKWDALYINQLTLMGRAVTSQDFYFRGVADYGRIFHGKNRDSDYLGNDRTGEFSRANCHAGRGEVFDVSLAFGCLFPLSWTSVQCYPLMGYSWHEQHLKMYGGKQVIAPQPDLLGDIVGLDSSYNTHWKGPWLGVDLFYDASCRLSLFGSFEFHWTEYSGQGHWNLRGDFLDDFKHHANGYGVTGLVGAKYFLRDCWNISLIVGLEGWKTGNGSHTVLVDLGEPDPVVIGTQLNSVHWQSATLTLATGYFF